MLELPLKTRDSLPWNFWEEMKRTFLGGFSRKYLECERFQCQDVPKLETHRRSIVKLSLMNARNKGRDDQTYETVPSVRPPNTGPTSTFKGCLEGLLDKSVRAHGSSEVVFIRCLSINQGFCCWVGTIIHSIKSIYSKIINTRKWLFVYIYICSHNRATLLAPTM